MCDTFCAIGRRGLLFAKSSDRPPDEEQVVEAFARRPAGGTVRTQYLEIPDAGAAAFVGSRPVWLWGVEHGVNEHGVAIGNEKLFTTGRAGDRAPGLIGMDLVRLGLERSRTAEEALVIMAALLAEHGQGGSGERDRDAPYDSSFLIADPTEGWILETCDRTWAAKPVGPGAAISNRITLTTDWSRGSPDLAAGTDFDRYRRPSVPTAIADHRLAATRACVADGADALDREAFVAVTRDHGTGPWGRPGDPESVAPPAGAGPDQRGVTVCMHVRGQSATTASMVVEVPRGAPGRMRVAVALGSPCVSVFVPLPDPGDVPGLLSDPATWCRFARLRDRVERDATALVGIRRALAPVEQRLWADPTRDLGPLTAALDQLGA